MTKFISTKECKWYKKEENGDFYLLVLSPQQMYESAPSSMSQIIFTSEKGVTLFHENEEKEYIPPFHLLHIKKNRKYKLHSEFETEVLIITFWKIEFLCSRNEVINILSSREYLNRVPRPLELKAPMRNYVESMKYYLHESLCCAHLQELKRRELSILFKSFYSLDDVASILDELLLNSTGFRKLVMDHVQTARTVSELARLCGYSPKTLERLFKEHYNTTPYKWMLTYKIDRLKELIANNEIPIKLIVSSLGFTSASHLNTFCKKHFGMTPSVLRTHIIKESTCLLRKDQK